MFLFIYLLRAANRGKESSQAQVHSPDACDAWFPWKVGVGSSVQTPCARAASRASWGVQWKQAGIGSGAGLGPKHNDTGCSIPDRYVMHLPPYD